jgi:hypothetical protein
MMVIVDQIKNAYGGRVRDLRPPISSQPGYNPEAYG